MVPGFGRDAARGLACGIVAVLASSPFSTALANDLRIETGAVERTAGSAGLRVSAKVAWKNAWRNARNYDAVWLFVKVRPSPNAPWRHVRLAATREGGPLACAPSGDHVGAFCRAQGRPIAAIWRTTSSSSSTRRLGRRTC